MLVVFGFNMVGDGLRDAFDPRFRGMIKPLGIGIMKHYYRS